MHKYQMHPVARMNIENTEHHKIRLLSIQTMNGLKDNHIGR